MPEPREPATPPPARRAHLRAALTEMVAQAGPERLLAPPVVPEPAWFPEPVRRTRGGVSALLRRLAWHAGEDRTVEIVDERLGAPPTERRPASRVVLTTVRPRELTVRLEYIGEDDVLGTLAHEIGVAFAVTHRPSVEGPYRHTESPVLEVDPERDLERGSIATVYLGLGTLATNAAFQQYSGDGRFNGGYLPLEYDVLRAGYLPMAELAYLLAVQAAVRGAPAPRGLAGPQADEVMAWLPSVRAQAAALRVELGLPPAPARDRDGVREDPPRPLREVTPLVDVDLDEDGTAPPRTAFRWRTHRGGVGLLAGALLGMGIATAMALQAAAPWIVIGAAGSGHVLGRRLRVPRCSACATVVRVDVSSCPHCGALLRGEIDRLEDRLED